MNNRIRISSLLIKNYKGIDELEIKWPDRTMDDEPDITAIGSKNGAGKTSILECCSLLMMAAYGKLREQINNWNLDFIRSGCKSTSISGVVTVEDKDYEIKVAINNKGKVATSGLVKNLSESESYRKTSRIRDIFGYSTEPVCSYRLFFMHGYRKTQEGSIALSDVLRDDLEDDDNMFRSHLILRRSNANMSMFKQMIMRWQMNKADLFEDKFKKPKDAQDEAVQVLDSLLQRYANVEIDKFRPYADNSLNLLVRSKIDDSIIFPIDGLSSGQKEIISSLFMIWEYTQKRPSVVLIDEPELHINTEWHRTYIHNLCKIAPNNQYIISTHSELVMDAVPYNHRFILTTK